jgi:biopolymer transport protein TolR
MARTFRRQRTAHPISELNVTNLIDVAFTLLIIFMIATPLINIEQTIRVNLPVESVSEQPRPDPRDRFETLTVQADGNVQLGNRSMTLRMLAGELERFAAEPRPPVITLRVDAKATAQHWVSVMAELKRHNLTRLSFDTQTVP